MNPSIQSIIEYLKVTSDIMNYQTVSHYIIVAPFMPWGHVSKVPSETINTPTISSLNYNMANPILSKPHIRTLPIRLYCFIFLVYSPIVTPDFDFTIWIRLSILSLYQVYNEIWVKLAHSPKFPYFISNHNALDMVRIFEETNRLPHHQIAYL